jgi:hypothetical protein
VLALAQKSGLGFLRAEDQGFELGGLVGSVAEGLALGVPAGAPGVFFSGFQLHLSWIFRGDMGFGHGFLLG